MPPMLVDVAPAGAGENGAEKEYLLERAEWLVQMRWFAVSGVLAAAAAAWVTGFAEPLLLASVGVGLAGWNVISRERLAQRRGAAVAQLRRLVFEQLLGDMAALALLLELSGGAENPFAMLFALPAAIGAMLLTTRSAIALAAIGSSFQLIVVLGQFTGILPHHGLHAALLGHPATIVSPLYRSWRFLVGYLTAFAVMMGAVVYFVRSVTMRYQRAEALRREHDRVAQSRERLARIGELSAGIAHAVRNPLHGLSGSVELLQHKLGSDARVAGNLELMDDALQRIETMTRRLLSLGRDAPLARVACDVDELVLDTVKLASPSTRRSQARLETDLGGVGRAEIDPSRLGEALINLVDNALDACRDGGVVTVRTRTGSADSVVVEVEDTGPGVDAELLRKVFDPFFTTKPVGEGTGLGLAISRRIVEEHGGDVVLDSEPSRGTRVSMTLPRVAAERSAA